MSHSAEPAVDGLANATNVSTDTTAARIPSFLAQSFLTSTSTSLGAFAAARSSGLEGFGPSRMRMSPSSKVILSKSSKYRPLVL